MTEEHDMPITEDLREMVGNPYPSADLAVRARGRAAELRRRRMASVTASAVAVGILAVPAFVVARDQSGSTNGVAGAGSSVGVKASASGLSVSPASAAAAETKTAVESATAKLTAVDDARVAAALHLLGTGFFEVKSIVIVDATSGVPVGTSAVFKATEGGGTVGVEWTAVEAVPAGIVTGAVGAEKGTTQSSGATGRQGGTTASGTVAISTDGKMELSLKVVQGTAGSTPILSGAAAQTTFVTNLLKLAS
jgi:hypothetical protein